MHTNITFALQYYVSSFSMALTFTQTIFPKS
jgi:hypothetical protein